MTTDPHPRWPDGLRVHMGDVGVVQITGATEYHSDYSPCWWVGAVTGLDWGIVRFGCGERLESELIGQVYGLGPDALDRSDATVWATATAAVDGLRALGCVPPRKLIEQALAECGQAADRSPSKLYSAIGEGDLDAIANDWDGQGSLGRHVNVWLGEHGFTWDPEQTDDANREDFWLIVDAAAARKAGAR